MKKKSKLLAVLSIMFALIFSLAACNSSEKTDTGGTDSKAVPGEGTINIGYTGPLSGPAAFYGERTLNGVQMAAEEINKAGGVEVNGKKYKLNIVSLDDKYLPNEAGGNAKRLMQENKTPIIFTPHSGGVAACRCLTSRKNSLLAPTPVNLR